MASLTELLPRLEEGALLQSSRGESLRLIAPGKVEWIKAKGFLFEVETVSLADLKNYKDMWDWQIVANSQGAQS